MRNSANFKSLGKKHFKDPYQELIDRRIHLVKFLSMLFFIGALIANSIYLFKFITSLEQMMVLLNVLIWILSIIGILGFGYIRFVYIKKNLKASFLILSTILFFISISNMMIWGIATSISFIIFAILISTVSIIQDTKAATKVLYIELFFIFLVLILHTTNVLGYTPLDTESTIDDVLARIFLLGIVIYISQTGFQQVHLSYKQNLKYTRKLKRLSNKLNKKVKEQTKQLEHSFEDKSVLLHNAMMIGSNMQLLLHDLASPLSSLKGATNLIDKSGLSDRQKKNFEVIKSYLDQTEKILIRGRKLVEQNQKETDFSILKSLKHLKQIFKSESRENSIKLKLSVSSKGELHGRESLFERIIVTILLNVINQIKSSKNKNIEITSEGKKGALVLRIEYQVTGKTIDTIFETTDFLFIKKTMKKNYKGKFTIKKAQKLRTIYLTFNSKFKNR